MGWAVRGRGSLRRGCWVVGGGFGGHWVKGWLGCGSRLFGVAARQAVAAREQLRRLLLGQLR
jgi:hypothetical protein